MMNPLLLRYSLTDPQVALLLRLHKYPRPLVDGYRPLRPLIEHELARPRAVHCPGSNYTYELTTKGRELAEAIVQEQADKENATSAARTR